jgi:hypothetical protein
MSCKHAENPCGDTCECCCDTCQAVYEQVWEERAEKEGLCFDCGMPKEPYSLDRLAQFQYVHFYCPCRDCAPGYQARMAAAGLCAICRRTLDEKGGCAPCQIAQSEMEREAAAAAARRPSKPSSSDRPAQGDGAQ